jgi:hypothetical protein
MKATLGTTAIISIFGFYSIKAILLFSYTIFRHIIDKNILISVAQLNTKNILYASRDLITWINYLTSYFAYLVPLTALIIYYSFILFSILYFPKVFKDIHVPKIILKDLQFELMFLFMIFGLSLLFKSVFTTINLQEIPLSLSISFITTLFRSYLETIRASS